MQDYIPYQLRTLITQIDPRLDFEWENTLQNIFSKISAQDQDNIEKQILRPKNIQWDKARNSFNYESKGGFHVVMEQIPHAGMKTLALKIFNSFSELEKYRDIHQIADYLESILIQIDKIDVEENLQLQQAKLDIRKEFIYSSAAIIVNKKNITPPDNIRNLQINTIKSFITEVFLKQQLLGYWFKTIRPHELESQSHPILKDFLKSQQKVRQLEIIKTSKYMFALAPSRDKEINPFSIRRFLQEETLAFSDNVYLNGATLDLRLLNNHEHIENFKWQVSRIVTIEKQISQQVIDLMDKFERYNGNQLLPFLFQPLDSSGLMIEKVIQQRLWDFEQRLVLNILEPLTQALQEIVTHVDECDYMFMSMRQLIGDIVSYFHDFQLQPAIMFDKQANIFSGRLNAYLTLLQKRQSQIFILLSRDDWQKNHEKMQEPTSILKKISKDSLQDYKSTYLEIKETQRLIKDSSNSFLGKMFNKTQKLENRIVELKNKAFSIREDSYLEIVRIPKNFPSLTVYLEFESLISINNKERHYAFPVGNNGVNRLPILVQLPEDRSLFNLQEVCNSLDFDLSLANQKWADTN